MVAGDFGTELIFEIVVSLIGMASERRARNEAQLFAQSWQPFITIPNPIASASPLNEWDEQGERKGSLKLEYISRRNRKYVSTKWMWQKSLESRRFIHSFDCRNFGNNLTHAEREKTLNNAMTHCGSNATNEFTDNNRRVGE